MKVFWSWQSDTPGKVGRHFVRDALKLAIEALRQAPAIEEPTDRESRERLHLDQDRAGVPGSPDLARTILEKIDSSAVFVADVTPVGASLDTKESKRPKKPKKLMNPNVAIELGYALRALSDRNFLMVMNEHYGSRDDLPFDLKHKAGPILYRLSPESSKDEIDKERQQLARQFQEALKPYIVCSAEEKPAPLSFRETRSRDNAALYFVPHEILGVLGSEDDNDKVEYRFDTATGAALRIIPTRQLDRPIPLADLLATAKGSLALRPFHRFSRQTFRQTNKYGVIDFEPRAVNILKAATQLFPNGEIWGFNSHLLPMERTTVLLPSLAIEETYRLMLPAYVSFMRDEMTIEPPYTIQCTIAGILDGYILMPENERWGPIHVTEVTHRRVLNDVSEGALIAFLLSFFEEIYDVTGYQRPQHFGGFPPRQ